MKTIMTLAAGVLCSTLAFANPAPGATGSSIQVTHSGKDLINVFYKAAKANTVLVSIFNEKEEKVFSERMTGENFMRPYNFKNLPAGEYTIQVEDFEGMHVQKISYGAADQPSISISKFDTKEGRYVVSGLLSTGDRITISIFDADGKSLCRDNVNSEGRFAQVYNLSSIKGAFSIQVSNTYGSLKEFNSTR